MESNSYSLIITLFILLVALVTTGLAIHYSRKAAKLSTKLSGALEKLANAHNEMQQLEQRYQETLLFQKNLNEAELTTRLQQPRLSAQHGRHSSAPERYLYVRSLAQSGMEAEEIATILSISTQEAEQLVNLSRLVAPEER